MRPVLLQLDDSLGRQTRLWEQVQARGGEVVDARDLGPSLRLWSRPKALEELRQRLERALAQPAPRLVFAGSGDFHHVTPMLVDRACEGSGRLLTVVHFDNHPDWVKFDNGMHCGSWVGRAARLPKVARVITVGVCSRDIDQPLSRQADTSPVADRRLEIYPYRLEDALEFTVCGAAFPTVEALGELRFTDLVHSRIATQCVYITIDKDVLQAEDAVTNWDQGRTSLSFLKTMIRVIARRNTVVGADVVGDWSRPAYGGGLIASWLKRGEALLDQPRSRPSAPSLARNETANMALLDLFCPVAP